jgi:hypothetical protein
MGFSITLIESPNGESLHGCPNSRFPVSLCALAPLREIPTPWIRSRAPLPSMGLPRAGRGRLRLEWSVAGTAAAWQDVDVSQSAGEIVPDRKLSLPPQWESGSRRDGIRTQIRESPVCLMFSVTVRRPRTLFG